MSLVSGTLRVLLGLVVHLDLLAIAGIAAGAALHRTGRQRAGLRLVIGSWIAIALVHLTPSGRWMMTALENRFPRRGEFPSVLPEDVAGLVLLGGGFSISDSRDRGEPVYNPSGPRFFEGLALARRYPRARVVFTGNADEAALARRVFAEHGIEASRIVLEDQSINTLDNARKTLERVGPREGEKWALVTSALHVPRSVGLFRGAGWEVIPCPVNHLTSGRYDLKSWLSPLGGTSGLAWRVAVHEWAGLAYHYLAGDSPELFPGP
ncbi:MAG: YdcF family protein [Planctomycetes bacterium]|nr:YdcF family protein [Planctomycetota bacterium]